MSTQVFEKDDVAYLEWINKNSWRRRAAVLNFDERFNYMIIHRADCGHIQGKQKRDGSWTEGQHQKTCYTDFSEIPEFDYIRKCKVCERRGF